MSSQLYNFTALLVVITSITCVLKCEETGMFSPKDLTNSSALRCGGLLTEASTENIFYKTSEPLLENERCSWTISFRDATGYVVYVQDLGTNNNPELPQRLSITGFKRGSDPRSIVPESAGEFTFTQANFLVITFQTGKMTPTPEKNETGFALNYTTIRNLNDATIVDNSNSQHFVFTSSTLNFQYPPGNFKGAPIYYKWNEYSSFLFPPKSNLFSTEHYNNLIYQMVSLQFESCSDHLKVLFFKASSNSWESIGRICGNVASQLIKSNDMTLIIFESDANFQYNGFRFHYV